MAREFKETAHLNNNPKKLADNWTHVYDRKNCECEVCNPEEALKELRRVVLGEESALKLELLINLQESK